MTYWPNQQPWVVYSPWVFANYGQPQRQRGYVSPIAFTTQPPQLGITPGEAMAAGFSPLFVLTRGLSAAASAYHGYRRSGRKTGSAVAWGLLGFVFPLITPIVAIVQGYGEPKALAANAGRRVVEMRCKCQKRKRTSRPKTTFRHKRPAKRPIAKRWEQ